MSHVLFLIEKDFYHCFNFSALRAAVPPCLSGGLTVALFGSLVGTRGGSSIIVVVLVSVGIGIVVVVIGDRSVVNVVDAHFLCTIRSGIPALLFPLLVSNEYDSGSGEMG